MPADNELKPTFSLRMAWVSAALVAGVSLLFVFAVLPYLGRAEVATVGKTAPEIRVAALDGAGELTLRAHTGKVVVIDFWASWCKPCEAQSRTLARALERRRGQPFAVLGVVTGDRLEDARRAAGQHPYPSGFDADGAVATAYGIGRGGPGATSGGLPTLVVVDPQQRVVAVREGGIDETALELLLEEAAP